MIVTIATFLLLAVLLRTRLLPLMSWSRNWRGRIAHALEVGSAILVLMLGMAPLLRP